MTSGEFYRGRGAASPPGSALPPLDLPSPRAGLTTGRVLPFRRRSVKPHRRRRSPWVRLAQPLATAILLVGVPVAAGVWLFTSPRFRLSVLQLEGGDPELRVWVQARLQPLSGAHLLLLPLAQVAEQVGEHRWIRGLEISKELPDRLRVVIRERLPEALVEAEGTLFYADREGRRIAPVEAPGAPGTVRGGRLLVVAGAVDEPGSVPGALEIWRQLLEAQPAWAAAVTKVEVLNDEDFRLHTTALPFPLLLHAGDVGAKVRWLESLLPELLDRYGELEAADLRFHRRIIVETGNRSPRVGASAR